MAVPSTFAIHNSFTAVREWQKALRTEHGRSAFVEQGVPQQACSLLKKATSVTRSSLEDLTRVVRLLRDTVPLGDVAVEAILRGGAVEGVVGLVSRDLTAHLDVEAPADPSSILAQNSRVRQVPDRGTQADGVALQAACAQLLANLANSGPAGAEAVWASCYPNVLLKLLIHPAGQVHAPATVALYACCRRDARRSRAVCGAGGDGAGPDVTAARQAGAAAAATSQASSTAEGAPATESASAGCPSALGASHPAGGSSAVHGTGAQDSCGPFGAGVGAGVGGDAGAAGSTGSPHQERRGTGADCPASTSPAGDAGSGCGGGIALKGNLERAIWVTLLSRLTEQHGKEGGATSSGGGGGGGGASGEWTQLLCSCVALRQGLLRPLLSLLSGGVPFAVGGCGGASSSGTRSGGSGDCAAAAATYGPLCPVLLHVLAHELEVMQGSGVVDVGSGPDGLGERVGPGSHPGPGCVVSEEGGAALTELPLGAEVLSQQQQQQQQQRDCHNPAAGVVDTTAGGSGMERGGEQQPHAVPVPVAVKEETCVGPGSAAPGDTAGPAAAASLPRAARPLASALLCAVEVAESAARCLAGSGGGAGRGGTPSTHGSVPADERPFGAAAVAAAAGGTPVGLDAGLGSSCGAGPSQAAPPSSVLEASLELIKALTQREDGGRALASGCDLVEWLLCRGGLLSCILGMLAALRPAAAARHSQRQCQQQQQSQRVGQAAGASSSGGTGGARGARAHSAAAPAPTSAAGSGPAPAAAAAGSAQPPSPPPPPPPSCSSVPAAGGEGDRPSVELPLQLAALAAGFPRAPQYVGYRGDLVSVLANGAFRRPAVAQELLRWGGLELLLAQTNLDEHSPLAREWALWGVRNMCEASEEVQRRIAGLELQTAVETPELQKLGLRLELDKSTGKMKVSKTAEAELAIAGIQGSAGGRQTGAPALKGPAEQ